MSSSLTFGTWYHKSVLFCDWKIVWWMTLICTYNFITSAKISHLERILRQKHPFTSQILTGLGFLFFFLSFFSCYPGGGLFRLHCNLGCAGGCTVVSRVNSQQFRMWTCWLAIAFLSGFSIFSVSRHQSPQLGPRSCHWHICWLFWGRGGILIGCSCEFVGLSVSLCLTCPVQTEIVSTLHNYLRNKAVVPNKYQLMISWKKHT